MLQISQDLSMSVGYFGLEKMSLLTAENIPSKLCCLVVIATENIGLEKYRSISLVLGIGLKLT